MQEYRDIVIDTNGRPVPGVSVAIQQAGVNVNIYSDNGVTLRANPIITDVDGIFQFYAADGTYQAVASGESETIYLLDPNTVSGIASASLMSWALVQAFQLVSATRNADDAITSASIVWPDGTTGTFTTDTLSTSFPGAIDAWHATYVGAVTKTVRQLAVTRDAFGAVIAQPAITIT